jgi:hypothetical protein
MKRLAATLVMGMLVALLVGTGVASAGSAGQDSAHGRVADAKMITLVFPPPVCLPFPPFTCTFPDPVEVERLTAEVDFNARASFNGADPSGSARFTFRDQDPDQVFRGDVTCLNVQGDTAILTGPITAARGGSTVTVEGQTYEPRSFVIRAVDNGDDPDEIGFELLPSLATDQTCYFEDAIDRVVRDGEVDVDDAL